MSDQNHKADGNKQESEFKYQVPAISQQAAGDMAGTISWAIKEHEANVNNYAGVKAPADILLQHVINADWEALATLATEDPSLIEKEAQAVDLNGEVIHMTPLQYTVFVHDNEALRILFKFDHSSSFTASLIKLKSEASFNFEPFNKIYEEYLNLVNLQKNMTIKGLDEYWHDKIGSTSLRSLLPMHVLRQALLKGSQHVNASKDLNAENWYFMRNVKNLFLGITALFLAYLFDEKHDYYHYILYMIVGIPVGIFLITSSIYNLFLKVDTSRQKIRGGQPNTKRTSSIAAVDHHGNVAQQNISIIKNARDLSPAVEKEKSVLNKMAAEIIAEHDAEVGVKRTEELSHQDAFLQYVINADYEEIKKIVALDHRFTCKEGRALDINGKQVTMSPLHYAQYVYDYEMLDILAPFSQYVAPTATKSTWANTISNGIPEDDLWWKKFKINNACLRNSFDYQPFINTCHRYQSLIRQQHGLVNTAEAEDKFWRETVGKEKLKELLPLHQLKKLSQGVPPDCLQFPVKIPDNVIIALEGYKAPSNFIQSMDNVWQKEPLVDSEIMLRSPQYRQTINGKITKDIVFSPNFLLWGIKTSYSTSMLRLFIVVGSGFLLGMINYHLKSNGISGSFIDFIFIFTACSIAFLCIYFRI